MVTFAILTAIVATTLMFTALFASFLGRHLDRGLAVAIAGLMAPVGIMVAAFVFVATDDANGPAPGNVLMGNLFVAVLLMPITLLLSTWIVKRRGNERKRRVHQLINRQES